MRVYQFRHIRAVAAADDIAHARSCIRASWIAPAPPFAGTAPPYLEALVASRYPPLSSRGLGRRPLMAETRVRIPVAVLTDALHIAGFWVFGFLSF